MIEFVQMLNKKGVKIFLDGADLKVNFEGDQLEPEILEQIRHKKNDLISFIKKYESSAKYSDIPVLEEKECYELSSGQRSLWLACQDDETSRAYNSSSTVELRGQYTPHLLERAITEVIKRHEILRTTFKTDKQGHVKQWITPTSQVSFKLAFEDVTGLSDKTDRIKTFIFTDRNKNFDLENGPLLRTKLFKTESAKQILYINLHHIVCDGWSIGVLFKDLKVFLDSIANETHAALPELHVQYKDYAEWEQLWLKSKEAVTHQQYWSKELSGQLQMLELPLQKIRPKIKQYAGKGLETYIKKDVVKLLDKFRKEQGGSLFVQLLAAWNVLFYRYTGNTDIIIGTPVAGRHHPALGDQVGFFINMLPMRNRVDPEATVLSFYQRAVDKTLKTFEYQQYPFDQLTEDLKIIRDPSRSSIFDISITLHNATNEEPSHYELSPHYDIRDTDSLQCKFDVELHFKEINEELLFSLNYDPQIYPEFIVRQLMGHFERMLESLCMFPQVKIKDVDYLLENEKRQLTIDFNHTFVAHDKEITFVDMFDTCVKKYPHNIAVNFEGKHYSYSDLNQYANALANDLIADYEIKPGDVVAIDLERSYLLIVAVIGVLKARGACICIHNSEAIGRKEVIMTGSSAKLLVTNTEKILDVIDGNSKMYAIDVQLKLKQNVEEHAPIDRVKPSDSAYLVYTSGSTGKPKGIEIKHHHLGHFCQWITNYFSFNCNSKSTVYAELGFDFLLMEIFGPLSAGACLFPLNNETRLDIQQYISCLKTNSITHTFLPTAAFNHFRKVLERRQDLDEIVFAVGGEYLKSEGTKLPKHFYNIYGPAENTFIATAHRVKSNEPSGIIGKPIDNNQLYILDKNQKLCPIGVVGEICISGAQLSSGYIKNSELTEFSFVKHPFQAESTLYKTGDMGRWHSDGTIEFIGRTDDQIKINGHRIELSEIELALERIEGVHEAIVLFLSNGINNYMAAFMTSDGNITPQEARLALSKLLPNYMIPSSFTLLENLPTTNNGKIDRKRLRDLESQNGSGKGAYLPPRNKVEIDLVALWEDLLNRSKIGINDDFFSLGGNSIVAFRIINKIKQEFEIELDWALLFNVTTIAELAEEIQNIKWHSGENGGQEISDKSII